MPSPCLASRARVYHAHLVVAVLCAVGPLGANSHVDCQNFASTSWVNMFGWVGAGEEARWEVRDGGRRVSQYINTPRPGFYISDEDDLINIIVTGTITVDSKADDDWVGLSVGHTSPMPEDVAKDASPYDTLLFRWGGGGYNSHAYIQRIDHVFPKHLPPSPGVREGHGNIPEGPCLFPGYEDKPAEEAAQRNEVGCFWMVNNPNTQWVRGVTYTLAALYTEDVFQVNINGAPLVKLTREDMEKFCATVANPVEKEKCRKWKRGRFAWFNFSQNGCIYGDVRRFNVNPSATDKSPVAAQDLYTLSRNPELTPYTALFYEGVLSNDHSPDLSPVQLHLEGSPTPIPVGGESTVVTELGASVTFWSNGSFVYTPPVPSPPGGEEDRVGYVVVDEGGRESAWVSVTFVIPPPAVELTGFAVSWAEESGAAQPGFYENITKGFVFGRFSAAGGCGPVKDWRLLGGAAGGRFELVAGPQSGAVLAVRDASRVALGDEEQFFIVEAEATDIYGQMARLRVSVRIPQRAVPCQPACPQHAQCISSTCVCDSGYQPPGVCDKYCPEGLCEDERPVVAATNDDEGCVVFAIGGQCLGWLVIVLVLLLFIFLGCFIYVWTHRGKKTTSKKRGARMKRFEMDEHMLEGYD